MNKALIFHTKVTLKNFIKSTLKKPFKTLGIVLAIAYFVCIPFFMQPLIQDFGFDTPQGFVILNTLLTLYVMMPATLSYFKRNGVLFTKQNVNFMFATPIPPKQILLVAILKQSYMSVLLQIAGLVAALFVFNIPLMTALPYSLIGSVLSFVSEYSLALILYGSERISKQTKKVIKWCVYALLVVVTSLIVFYFYQEGISLETGYSLLKHPIILGTPIFGWQLGWMQLMILGPTTLNIVVSILYVLSTLGLLYGVYKMQCTGDYYEDALNFAEKQARIVEKGNNASFSEMMGKKRKVHKAAWSFTGSGASAIFSRQWLELKRTRRFYVSTGDIIMFIVSCIAGFVAMKSEFSSDSYFAIVCGIAIYFALFFNPSPAWSQEFSSFYLYVIPDTMSRKLWFSTALEHCLSLIRSIVIAVPLGLFMRASFLDIFYGILAQTVLKVMVTYLAILTEGYMASKVGKNFAQILRMVFSFIVFIPPIIGIVVSTQVSSTLGFVIIATYSGVMTGLFLFLCAKVLTNLESLRG